MIWWAGLATKIITSSLMGQLFLEKEKKFFRFLQRGLLDRAQWRLPSSKDGGHGSSSNFNGVCNYRSCYYRAQWWCFSIQASALMPIRSLLVTGTYLLCSWHWHTFLCSDLYWFLKVSVDFDELYDRIPHPDVELENSIEEVSLWFWSLNVWLAATVLMEVRSSDHHLHILHRIVVWMEIRF